MLFKGMPRVGAEQARLRKRKSNKISSECVDSDGEYGCGSNDALDEDDDEAMMMMTTLKVRISIIDMLSLVLAMMTRRHRDY